MGLTHMFVFLFQNRNFVLVLIVSFIGLKELKTEF